MSRPFCAAIAIVAAALVTACTETPSPVEPATLPARVQPLIVDAAGSFHRVAADFYDTCAIRSDGAAECWGQYLGGAGSVNVATTSTFVGVSVGYARACGLRADGAVECWGPAVGPDDPPIVPATGKFKAMAIGLQSGCGVRSDGVMECWGIDKYGQAPPLKSPAVGKFTAVDVNYLHTCALRDDGKIECFGADAGTGRAPTTKTAVVGKFTAVDIGEVYSCALRDDGAIECWGIAPGDIPLSPVKQAAVGKFTALSASNRRTCGLRNDGAIDCWTYDSRDSELPTKVAAVGKFTNVSTGPYHTCGLRTDGIVECWGDNTDGQAPATRSAGSIKVRINPTATFTAPTAVIVGQSISLGLTNAQVPGHPEATAFTYAFNCGAGYQPATSVAAAACASGAPGSKTVKAKVIDTDGDVAEYTKTVTVLSASEAISQLKAAIAAAPGVAATVKNPLTVKLDAANAALAKKKFDTACVALGDFQTQVTDKRGKGIPVATADAWLLTVADIKTAIGCSGGC